MARPSEPPGFQPPQAACPEGWIGLLNAGLCLWAGGAVALAVAVASWLGGNLPSGHLFNDPVLLGISAWNADQAAKVAVFLTTLPIWLQEIRSFQVLLWYGLATWFAMVIAGLVARQLARI